MILEAAQAFVPTFGPESMQELAQELAGLPHEECEAILEDLVTTGFLRRQPGLRGPRYRRLPADELADLPISAERAAHLSWHAIHFLLRAQNWRAALDGPGCGDALDAIQDDLHNLARAYEYLLANGFEDGAAAIALAMAAAAAIRPLEVDRCAMLDRIGEPASRKIHVEVLVELSACRQTSSDWDGALELAQRAVGMAAGCHDPGLYSLTLRRLGTVLHWRGKSEPALDCFGEAEILAKRAGDAKAVACCMHLRGMTYYQIGDLESAAFSFRRAEDIARERQALRLLAQVLGYRASVDRRLGDFAAALVLYQEAESVARSIGDGVSVIHSLRNQGILHRQQGHTTRASECFTAAEALARSLDNKFELSSILTNRATILGDNGRYVEALECFCESEALHRELGYQLGIATCLSNRGGIHLELAEYDQALVCIDEADEIYRETCELRGLCTNCLNRAAIHERRGDLEEALASYLITEALAAETGDKIYMALAHAGHGRIRHAQGSLGEARDQMRSAAQTFDELGFHQQVEYVRNQELLARTEDALGDRDAAVAVARKALLGLAGRETESATAERELEQLTLVLRTYWDEDDTGRASG